jgi:hypothetical protein
VPAQNHRPAYYDRLIGAEVLDLFQAANLGDCTAFSQFTGDALAAPTAVLIPLF